jgi:hypothetical protein
VFFGSADYFVGSTTCFSDNSEKDVDYSCSETDFSLLLVSFF